MIYSDWREELILIEGAKTRIVIKGLRKLGLIKKPKIKKASGMLPDIDPDLFAQFPGVNYRKLLDPNYKAPRNPKLAKAIKITKDKLDRGKNLKFKGASPYSTDLPPPIPNVRTPIPPKVSQQIKSNLNKVTKLTDDQKEKNYSDYLKSLKKRVKDKKKNLKTYEGDDKYYPPEIGEEVMAAPTNSVGGGQIAGTVEAGDDPPKKKKKKKTYAYGGRGSRKMWMSNK